MSRFSQANIDTICAISTPPGVGGISVIRVCGIKAWDWTRVFVTTLPESSESHRVFHGVFRDPRSVDPIDEIVVAYFSKGKSYTGDETAEISCHGSPIICQMILDCFVFLGARLARPGEFTSRAFMNGRIDLIQAEGVLSLIESRSRMAARVALRQLQGSLSKEIERIEDRLIWAMAHVEAGIDFSSEGLDVVDESKFSQELLDVERTLTCLVDSYRSGRLIRDGIQIALLGLPNAGKSSLLNNLLEEERAIVTDIPGTTRDVVEGETFFEGRRFVFQDTAGFRESSDQVEAMGIQKSIDTALKSDLNVIVIDSSEAISNHQMEWLKSIDLREALLFFNKVDLMSALEARAAIQVTLSDKIFTESGDFPLERVFFGNALDKSLREPFLSWCSKFVAADSGEGSAVVCSARHHEKLSIALRNVRSSRTEILNGVGYEFVAFDLKEAIVAVQEVLGKHFDDQIMDRVFKDFCIGK